MGRLRRNTVIVPIRVKKELLVNLNRHLDVDPRFSSMAELVLFCIQQAYGKAAEEIGVELSLQEKRTQSIFDQLVKKQLISTSKDVRENSTIFDMYDGSPSTILVRMSEDLLEQLDVLCFMLSVKRVDFIKYSIIKFGTFYSCLSFDQESILVLRNKDGDHYIELKMGEEWRSRIAKEVDASVKAGGKSIKLQE